MYHLTGVRKLSSVVRLFTVRITSPSFYFRLLTVQTRGTMKLADSSECFWWETALYVVHHYIPVRNMPPPHPSLANSTRELPIKYVYK